MHQKFALLNIQMNRRYLSVNNIDDRQREKRVKREEEGDEGTMQSSTKTLDNEVLSSQLFSPQN